MTDCYSFDLKWPQSPIFWSLEPGNQDEEMGPTGRSFSHRGRACGS